MTIPYERLYTTNEGFRQMKMKILALLLLCALRSATWASDVHRFAFRVPEEGRNDKKVYYAVRESELIVTEVYEDMIGNQQAQKLGDLSSEMFSKSMEKILGLASQRMYLLTNQSLYITELNLSKQNINDRGVAEIMKILDKLYNKKNYIKYLTKLNLQDNNISFLGFKEVAKSMRENNTITELNLSANQGGDEGLKVLLENLQKNTALKRLILADNSYSGGEVGFRKVEYISNFLKDNKTLKCLSVKLISDRQSKEILELVESLKFNYSIENLNIFLISIVNGGTHYTMCGDGNISDRYLDVLNRNKNRTKITFTQYGNPLFDIFFKFS